MSDALNHSDFLDVTRLFVSTEHRNVDQIIAESTTQGIYMLTVLIGSDRQTNDELFVITRTSCEPELEISGGSWKKIDMSKTILRTEYKNRNSAAYKNFEEFYQVLYWSGDEIISITRDFDEFGLDKFSIILEGDRYSEFSRSL